jgi:hypothetical protein
MTALEPNESRLRLKGNSMPGFPEALAVEA